MKVKFSKSISGKGSKMKKFKEKKLKSKIKLVLLTPFIIQSQFVNLKSLDINKEKLHVLYEKMVKKSKKNIINAKNILEK